MPKDKILVVWSNYYNNLAKKQLDSCIEIIEQSPYDFEVETVAAGTYEIPTVIQYFHRNKSYAGYLPLSLLLKGSTDHYEFIWQHVKECFIQFALDGVLLGNGIISAPTMDLLESRVENRERVEEAYRALDYLIQFKAKHNFRNSS